MSGKNIFSNAFRWMLVGLVLGIVFPLVGIYLGKDGALFLNPLFVKVLYFLSPSHYEGYEGLALPLFYAPISMAIELYIFSLVTDIFFAKFLGSNSEIPTLYKKYKVIKIAIAVAIIALISIVGVISYNRDVALQKQMYETGDRAVDTKNPSLCETLPSEGARDYCYMRVGSCDKIISPDIKKYCN